MEIHFFVTECTNKSYSVIDNTLNVYKLNKLLLVTSCFNL